MANLKKLEEDTANFYIFFILFFALPPQLNPPLRNRVSQNADPEHRSEYGENIQIRPDRDRTNCDFT